VLFRDLGGRIGLLHRHCAHRRASLEYGIIAEQGLRCCYHGWLFDIDGTVLETPGEPPASHLKESVSQGAYPTHEHRGLVFAYLGPPGEPPEFPAYDTYEVPGGEMVPYSLEFPCNWLQIRENAIDPFHTPFLHTRISGPQFHDTWAELPIVDYHARPDGFFYTNARRIGDNIWIRFHDVLDPNFSQQGAISEDGRKPKYFGRGALSKWAVPVDNTHSKVFGFRHFNPRGDAITPTSRDQLGVGKVDHVGQTGDRPYVESQRHPSDYEAWIGQGPITVHKREYLGTTDLGIVMLRKRLRQDIDAIKSGDFKSSNRGMASRSSIPTCAGDTVLRVPPGNGDDRKLILNVSRKVATAYKSGDHLTGVERYKFIEAALAALEKDGDFGGS
jgi:phenylpropionate dioxygenase-like ring-hydroxylating dioxygenase large terminal subunit